MLRCTSIMGNLALHSAEEPDNQRAITGTAEVPAKRDDDALALGARPIQEYEHAARHTTQEAPLFIGPILLHCNGKFRMCHDFFSHVYGLLADGLVGTKICLSNLTTGNDDEKVMEKALDAAFPAFSTYLLRVAREKERQ